jgi:excisionase family DNA binding protein
MTRPPRHSRPALPADPDALLSVPQLAALLGVSIAWVHDRHRALRIPSVRIGGLLRFERAAVLEWLREQPRAFGGVVPFPPRRAVRRSNGVSR